MAHKSAVVNAFQVIHPTLHKALGDNIVTFCDEIKKDIYLYIPLCDIEKQGS